jgi:fatty acid amide hydrolase
LAIVKAMLRLARRSKTVEVIECFGPYGAVAYWTACERQLDYQARWRAVLDTQHLDVVLSPAAALPAVKHGATVEVGVMGAYTCLYNVLGWPAGVVPVTRVREDEETSTQRTRDVADVTAVVTERSSKNLPIGVQVAARPWREDLVLAALSALTVPR